MGACYGLFWGGLTFLTCTSEVRTQFDICACEWPTWNCISIPPE